MATIMASNLTNAAHEGRVEARHHSEKARHRPSHDSENRSGHHSGGRARSPPGAWGSGQEPQAAVAQPRLTPVLPGAPDAPAAEDAGAREGAGVAVRRAVRYTARQQLYLLLEDPESSLKAQICSHCILYVIVASIACFVLETVPALRDYPIWKVAEPATTVIFTVEYICRFVACDAFPPGCFGHQSKCGFIKSPMNVLDLTAILPFYLELAAEELMKKFKFLRVLRSVRLIRCFRIFKLSKYSLGMTIMVESLLNSVQPLSILMFFLSIGVVLTSSLMFFAERTGCPDVKSMIASGTFDKYKSECLELDTGRTRSGELCCNEHGSALDFPSIFTTFWWSMVTMATVGYGDRVPRTLPGRLVGCTAMLSGIVLISLPVAIVGSKFQLAYESLEEEKKTFQNLDDEEREKLLDEAHNRTGVANTHQKDYDKILDLVQADEEEKKQALPSDETSFARSGFGPEHMGGQLNDLRAKLKALELKPQISEKAVEEIYLLLEMFDHVERVEKQLRVLRDRDTALDVSIRREFASLSRSYDATLREKGLGINACDPT